MSAHRVHHARRGVYFSSRFTLPCLFIVPIVLPSAAADA
jgi:hypothetical protein